MSPGRTLTRQPQAPFFRRYVLTGAEAAEADAEIRADEAELTEQVHFLLHHRGRCYAEQGQPEQAQDCFRQALALREQLGDPRFIASTRNALADLPGWPGNVISCRRSPLSARRMTPA